MLIWGVTAVVVVGIALSARSSGGGGGSGWRMAAALGSPVLENALAPNSNSRSSSRAAGGAGVVLSLAGLGAVVAMLMALLGLFLLSPRTLAGLVRLVVADCAAEALPVAVAVTFWPEPSQ